MRSSRGITGSSSSSSNSSHSHSRSSIVSDKLFPDRFAALVRTDLPLCSAVWKEAIRLKSPVSALQLETSSAKYFSKLSNGLIIRPKDQLYLRLDAVLWDEEVFGDAEKFLPHRWLGQGIRDMKQLQAMNKYFALAFGRAPRSCPWAATAPSNGFGSGGGEFALMEHGALILAHLAGRFDFQMSKVSAVSSPSKNCVINRQSTSGMFAEPDCMPVALQRRKQILG